MREICTSGSEGGGIEFNQSSLPLSTVRDQDDSGSVPEERAETPFRSFGSRVAARFLVLRWTVPWGGIGQALVSGLAPGSTRAARVAIDEEVASGSDRVTLCGLLELLEIVTRNSD